MYLKYDDDIDNAPYYKALNDDKKKFVVMY